MVRLPLSISMSDISLAFVFWCKAGHRAVPAATAVLPFSTGFSTTLCRSSICVSGSAPV